MLKARVGNTSDCVTVEEFLKKYGLNSKSSSVDLFCPLCHEPVFVYGAHSIFVTARFHHMEGATECLFSNRQDMRYSWLIPRDVDIESGKRLKEFTFERDNLRQIYAFCHHLSRKQAFPSELFCDLIKLADRKNIWVYRNLPFWVVGYILMTLRDFEGKKQDGKKFIYRFIFEREKPKTVEELWENQGQYKLLKIFDGGRQMDYPPDNPFVVSEENFEALSINKDWIGDSNIQALLRCAPKRDFQ